MPRCVAPTCSQTSHVRPGWGQLGAPSKSTTVAPKKCTPMSSQGPIIQPMSVTQKKTSSGLTSKA